MLRRKLEVAALAVLVVTLVLTGHALARKQFFAIATGGTGGTYYPLGGVLAQAMSKKVSDIIVTAQSGNASVANCNLIREHEIESAFVQNNVAYAAFTGTAQFDGQPVKNIRGIASLYPETIQIVAQSDAGITTAGDLKGKRLVPGDRGSGTEVDCQNVLKGYGLTYKDFTNVDWLGFSGAAQRLKDKQADVAFITAGWPTSSITELATQTGITLVSIEPQMVKKLTDMYPFYASVTIPAGTYPGMDKDVQTITTMAQWVVDAKVSDDVVYQLTRALWEQGKFVQGKAEGQAADVASAAEIMARAHEKGKDVTLATALSGMAIPLHPGAEKYYREKGLIK